MKKFTKIDLLASLIIGEVVALLIVLIAKNLGQEVPIFTKIPYLNFLPIIFPTITALGLYISYLISKFIPPIFQFGKFILVGGFNFLIDMGVLNFLIFFTGIAVGFEQTMFKSFSFLVATTNSYLWNKFWTFEKKEHGDVGKEFAKFLVVSFIGFLINVGIDYILVNNISPLAGMSQPVWAQFSAMMASVVALFWNFVGYKFVVFGAKINTNE